MDDERTPQPQLPPPPRPTPPDPAPVGWNPPGPSAGEGQAETGDLDLGLIVGRTFDTLGREWSLFLALAVPAGLSGVASAMLSPSLQAIMRDPASAAAADQAPVLAAQVAIGLVSGVTTLATVVATDALWRGRAVGLGEAIRPVGRLLPRAIGLLLLAVLIGLGFGVAIVASLLLIGAFGPGGALIGILGVLALVILAAYVGARLSLLLPVLVLEDVPLAGVVGRAWRLAKGRVLMLFVTSFVIGLCALLPTWGATVFGLFVEDRLVAGIALGLATMVTAPLSGIWVVLAWGSLTRAAYVESDVMRTGQGRAKGALLVVGVGLLLMLLGGALAGTGSDELLGRLARI